MPQRAGRKRADVLLVDKGLAESREQARTLIMAGLVFAADGRVEKPGTPLSETTALEVRQRLPYVSRGGLKLAHALDSFSLSVEDLAALDVAPPPAVSPTACCNEERDKSTRWTWVTAS